MKIDDIVIGETYQIHLFWRFFGSITDSVNLNQSYSFTKKYSNLAWINLNSYKAVIVANYGEVDFCKCSICYRAISQSAKINGISCEEMEHKIRKG